MRRATAILIWLPIAAVFIAPLVVLLGLLFIEGGQFTFAGPVSLVQDRARLVMLLGNTLQVLIITVGVALVFGAPLGFMLFRVAIPGRSVLQGLCLVSACVPLYVTTTMWMSLFGMPVFLEQAWAALRKEQRAIDHRYMRDHMNALSRLNLLTGIIDGQVDATLDAKTSDRLANAKDIIGDFASAAGTTSLMVQGSTLSALII